MMIKNLRAYKGFDRENDSGCKLHPLSLVMIKSLTYFQICYLHEIRIACTKIMKHLKETKTAFTRFRSILKTVKNVTDRPPVHTKTAHFLPADFENDRF